VTINPWVGYFFTEKKHSDQSCKKKKSSFKQTGILPMSTEAQESEYLIAIEDHKSTVAPRDESFKGHFPVYSIEFTNLSKVYNSGPDRIYDYPIFRIFGGRYEGPDGAKELRVVLKKLAKEQKPCKITLTEIQNLSEEDGKISTKSWKKITEQEMTKARIEQFSHGDDLTYVIVSDEGVLGTSDYLKTGATDKTEIDFKNQKTK
jgi:hypothetical protein